MKRWIVLGFLILGACSVATQQLDQRTGTTKAQRCADYQGFLAAAVALQEASPSDARGERIKYYRAFIAANCEVK